MELVDFTAGLADQVEQRWIHFVGANEIDEHMHADAGASALGERVGKFTTDPSAPVDERLEGDRAPRAADGFEHRGEDLVAVDEGDDAIAAHERRPEQGVHRACELRVGDGVGGFYPMPQVLFAMNKIREQNREDNSDDETGGKQEHEGNARGSSFDRHSGLRCASCEYAHSREREGMKLRLEPAREEDAAAIAAVRLAAARDLTARFGRGTWSFAAESVDGVRMDMRSAHVFLARDAGTVIATLRLSERNPWLGDTGFFTRCTRPLYLTSMAVLPSRQRCGVGRQCLEEAARIATEWPADAIRLDTYDAPAGAAEFYRRCGFREVHRATYNGTPLRWFERLIPPK